MANKMMAISCNTHGRSIYKLSDFYYSWSSSAADFNHDGILDLVSGPYIYYGPDYTKYREMYLAETVNPSTKFATDAWMDFAADFTGAAAVRCGYAGLLAGDCEMLHRRWWAGR